MTAPSHAAGQPSGGFAKPPLRIPPRRAARPVKPADPDRVRGQLKLLVWAYFWLLIFEGALRKWVVPQLSAPLLIVRDPVVILICGIAWQHGIFPRHKLFPFFMFLAAAGVLLLVCQWILLGISPAVLAYGYRCLFLHLPLIFLLPHIFDYHDVVKLGKWVLILSIPMAILMALQFNSPKGAWINRTAGTSDSFQLSAALGRIRPPATFSFISGSVAFFALVTAFAGYGLVSRNRPFPKWLVLLSAAAIGLATAVSGSRATILSGGIVVLTWVIGVTAGKRLGSALGNALVIVLAATFILGHIELFEQGKEVLDVRFEIGQRAEADEGGIAGRFLRDLIGPLKMVPDLPFFGAGLGLGTNVGAALITGRKQFLLSEGEWGRNLLEMGPLFGLLFIWFRVLLTFQLGRDCLRAAADGRLLPLLLFSACAVNVFSGQISQPTTLGFTTLVAGLCLAALSNIAQEQPEFVPAPKPIEPGTFAKPPLRA